MGEGTAKAITVRRYPLPTPMTGLAHSTGTGDNGDLIELGTPVGTNRAFGDGQSLVDRAGPSDIFPGGRAEQLGP